MAGDDDDRRGLLAHQQAQEREAVHAGHLEIERDRVGLELERLRQAVLAVGRLAHDLHLSGGLQGRDDVLAVERRVVDDEHAQRGTGGAHQRARLLLAGDTVGCAGFL